MQGIPPYLQASIIAPHLPPTPQNIQGVLGPYKHTFAANAVATTIFHTSVLIPPPQQNVPHNLHTPTFSVHPAPPMGTATYTSANATAVVSHPPNTNPPPAGGYPTSAPIHGPSHGQSSRPARRSPPPSPAASRTGSTTASECYIPPPLRTTRPHDPRSAD
jgi:hypothetical protein